MADSASRDECECSICCELFVEPVRTPCNHIFCRACLSVCLVRRAECPLCRGALADLAQLVAFQPVDAATESRVTKNFGEDAEEERKRNKIDYATDNPAVKQRLAAQGNAKKQVVVKMVVDYEATSQCYKCRSLLKHPSSLSRVRCGGCGTENAVARRVKCIYCPHEFYVEPGTHEKQCEECGGNARYTNNP